MPALIDLTGRHIERLTVVALAPRGQWVHNNEGRPMRSWLCRCSCNGRLLPHAIPTSKLRSYRGRPANTRSCGCLQRKKASDSGRVASSHARRKCCRHCGRQFDGTNKQRFCDRVCKEANELAPRREDACLHCGKAIKARSDQWYCSEDCKRKYGRRLTWRRKVVADLEAIQRRLVDGESS
jgi:hypothetical protein